VLRNRVFILVVWLGVACLAAGQQPPSQPQVKLNMLNVCSPSPQDQQEISSALNQIPKKPAFGPDFEVDRGRSTLEQSPDFLQAGANAKMSSDTGGSAAWVRIRHEFPGQALFSTVQYSFSKDPRTMVETLVLRVRDPKDLLEVAIEDGASAVTSPQSMLSTNTPATRIKLERFGKSSVVLARCPGTEATPPPDQSAYEPLFQSASTIMGIYRQALNAASVVSQELTRVGGAPAQKPKTRTGEKKPDDK
jgi:hypothetical protein